MNGYYLKGIILNIFLVAKKHRRTSKVKRYPTDLNDKKWKIIKPLLPRELPGGRPRKVLKGSELLNSWPI
ncbi:hypothetical protein BHECKSOX_2315 [Bathymodiolus heckerae thiotrophic gill symbiont]|nr:hypothetical protein BHECKSOX_2315 [Bathymodiolus heckerae thiotrophic gill symbiont]